MIPYSPREVQANEMLRPVAVFIASLATTWVTLRFAVSGVLSTWSVALLLPASLLVAVVAFFRVGSAMGPFLEDERGESRPLGRRHGFWLVATGILLYAPTYGAFSLTDPWETHYAEVAREMLARHDYVSPWWANEGWFRTKPVLTLWLEALAMRTFGVGVDGSAVLLHGRTFAHPEWAVRFPTFALSLLGAYGLYYGVSRTIGRRAGLLGGLVLLTMPGYAVLAHQAITDMPLVAGGAATIGALLVAVDPSRPAELRSYNIALSNARWTFHGGHLVAGMFALLVVPQAALLLSEHVHHGAHGGLTLGLDRVMAGSPRNCTLPGQPRCAWIVPAHPMLQPFLQVALWSPVALLVGWALTRLTRTTQVFLVLAAICASIGAMSKGPLGLAIPLAALLVHVARERSFAAIGRLGGVAIGLAVAVAVVTIGPWYLAAFARHGRPFIDELVVHHMFGRTLDHLHDTNEGEDVGISYFVRQLGYATFPWSGLCVLAIAQPRGGGNSGAAGRTKAVLGGAMFLVFTLVTLMRTKFHHYALPALPFAASLLGIWLDERLAAQSSALSRRATGAHVIFAAAVTLRVGFDLTASSTRGAPSGAARIIQLMTYRYSRTWPDAASFGVAFGIVGLVVLIVSIGWLSRRIRSTVTVALVTVALLQTAVVVDVYLPRVAKDGGQRGIFEAYYRDVTDPVHAAPLVAYRLNWKGENFYTGNHVALFISSGAPFTSYLEGRRKRGQTTVYLVTETSLVPSLQREVGRSKAFVVLTDATVSSEFRLVRVELEPLTG